MKVAPRKEAVGVALGAAAAFSYGLTVVLGRALAQSGLGSRTVLGIRFGIAALLSAAILAVTGGLRDATKGWLAPFLLGALLYSGQSTLFFAALERGSAAAVTLLFYTYPAIVVLLELPLRRRFPGRSTLLALLLCTAGTIVIVAASGEVDITRTGIAFAIGAGAAFAAYVIVGERLAQTVGSPLARAMWVAAGASVALLALGGVTGELRWPGRYLPHLIGTGAATAAAFALLFAALRRARPAEVAVVMTLEAFSATALAAIFLREPVRAAQIGGGLAVLVGAAVIGVSSSRARPADVAGG